MESPDRALRMLVNALDALAEGQPPTGDRALLARRAVAVTAALVPGADLVTCGVAADTDDRAAVLTLAGNSPRAAELDRVQGACGEGPTLEVLLTPTAGAAACRDLAAAGSPWPRFARLALALGVKSVLACGASGSAGRPLAVTLYSPSPDAFCRDGVAGTARVLTRHIAMLWNAAEPAPYNDTS
ncbi:MAG: hypothetical protein HOV68_24620 [Streptomycetaceae bacterium]|nr:hypothetical protein [Streptomycetaceae bacterium]